METTQYRFAPNGNTPTEASANAKYLLPTIPALTLPEAGEKETHPLADQLARRRDKHGNRLPWFYAHSIPTISEKPLQETALSQAISAISQHDAITSAELEHYYDEKLRTAREALTVLHTEEQRRLAAANEKAEVANARLDREIEQANLADSNALHVLENRLFDAQKEAAHKVAAAGGEYDPANPAPQTVLCLSREDEAALAAELSLPWTANEKTIGLGKGAGSFLTLMVGLMLGLSLGILSGFVPVGNWTAKPLPFTFFLLVGLAAALGGKGAIRHSAAIASGRYWLGKPFSNWGGFALLSICVTILLIAIDACVEREGLMANLRMQDIARVLSSIAPSGTAGSKEGLYFLMAIILTFGYAINAYWEGYLAGCYDACSNRLRHEQDKRYHAQRDVRRACPEVREALDALARVTHLLHEMRGIETRIAARTARLEESRLPVQESLSDEACLRLQDARDNFEGAQATFDALFTSAKTLTGGQWGRLVHTLQGGDKPHFAYREQKRRIR